MLFEFLTTCSEGLELLLADELQSFGHDIVHKQRHLIISKASLPAAYRTCLWSRLASRILLPLFSSPMIPPESLSSWVRSLNWNKHFAASATVAVRARIEPGLAWPEQLTALRIKDGYADYWRDQCGSRPEVDTRQPDVPLYVHVGADSIQVGLDLSADSLHKRGLRPYNCIAPLKETLAAALLIQSGWPNPKFQSLLDPMCGSGTLLLEALMMLSDHAPGLQRQHWGFLAWSGHDPVLWQELVQEALQRRRRHPNPDDPKIFGSDSSLQSIETTRKNMVHAEYADWVCLEQNALAQLPQCAEPGLIVCNPPYGERIWNPQEAALLYQALGRLSSERRPQQVLTVIAPNIEWLDKMGLHTVHNQRVNNGELICYMRTATMPQHFVTPSTVPTGGSAETPWQHLLQQAWDKHCTSGQQATRLYDQQLNEYPLRIDIYGERLSVVEMHNMPPEDFRNALAQLRAVLGITRDRIRIGRARHQPEADWQYFAWNNQTYLLDFSRSDDAGLQLPLQNLYTHIQSMHPRRCLHLFSHNSTLALQLQHEHTYTHQWEPRPHWPQWARQQWALNGYSVDDLALEQSPLDQWLNRIPRQDVILLTPAKSHYAEQKRQGFRWRDVHENWIRTMAQHLSTRGELWFVVDEKSFQLSTKLQSELQMREQDMLPDTCFSLRGHLRFFVLMHHS